NNALQDGNRVVDLNFVQPSGGITLGGEFVPLGGALGRRRSPLTIVDDDFSHGVFNFTSSTYATNENALTNWVTIIRTNGSVGTVSVDFYTRNSSIPPIATATGPDADYIPVPPTKLTFLSGQTSKTIGVPIIDDTAVEFDENIE